MARDSLSTENATHEHAKVSSGSKQDHETKEKDHSNRNSRFWRNCARGQSYAMGNEENSGRQDKQKRSPIENSRRKQFLAPEEPNVYSTALTTPRAPAERNVSGDRSEVEQVSLQWSEEEPLGGRAFYKHLVPTGRQSF